MHNLKEIQNNLIKGVFHPAEPKLECIKIASNIKNKERFNIYKHTILSNLLSCLKNTYPGIYAIIGEKEAAKLSRAFIKLAHLKRRSQINNFGLELPDFIASHSISNNFPYLSEYAKLELKRSKSYHSNPYSINEHSIQQALQNNIENLKITFNNSLSLMQTKWPLDLIQEHLNQKKNFKKLPLINSSRYIMIFLLNQKVVTLYIEKPQWEIISKLQKGFTLAESINDNTNKEVVTSCLSLLFQNKLITKFAI